MTTHDKPIDLARRMVAQVDKLAAVPGMMVSYDIGRYTVSKAYVQLFDSCPRESPEAVCEEILGHIDAGKCDAMAIQRIVRRVMVRP